MSKRSDDPAKGYVKIIAPNDPEHDPATGFDKLSPAEIEAAKKAAPPAETKPTYAAAAAKGSKEQEK